MRRTIYLLILILLSACYEPIGEEKSSDKDKEEGTCQLQISVCSSEAYAKYPVNLLIFDTDGNRLKNKTLTEESPTAFLTLNRGDYRIVALSGTSYYQLPANYSLESIITFSTQSLPLEPLLMGEADVVLASETARAKLQLIPQTAEISIKSSSLSSLTKQVRIQLSSLYTEVDMQGSYSTPKKITVECSKTSSGWSAGPYHLFSAKGTNTIVSMEVIRTDSTLNFGYMLPYPIQAGYQYELEISQTGLLANNEQIDPSSTHGSAIEDTLQLTRFPNAPGLWDGHIVVYEEESEDDEADFWLMSINEWEDIHSANATEYSTEATDIASTYQEGGTVSGRISSWHIPTREEVNMLRSLYAGDKVSTLNDLLNDYALPVWSLTDEDGDNLRYLCSEGIYTFSLASSSTSITKGGTKATYHLRLLKKIHAKKG